MSKGTLRISTNEGEYFADIIHLVNEDSIGNYTPSENEYKLLTYDLGYCDCYELSEDDVVNSIEVEEWNVGIGVEGKVDVEVVKTYFDHNHNCCVIEFRS